MKKDYKHIKNFLVFKKFQDEYQPKKFPTIPVLLIMAVLITLLVVLVKCVEQ